MAFHKLEVYYLRVNIITVYIAGGSSVFVVSIRTNFLGSEFVIIVRGTFRESSWNFFHGTNADSINQRFWHETSDVFSTFSHYLVCPEFTQTA